MLWGYDGIEAANRPAERTVRSGLTWRTSSFDVDSPSTVHCAERELSTTGRCVGGLAAYADVLAAGVGSPPSSKINAAFLA